MKNLLPRRSFLKGSALAGAATAAVGLLPAKVFSKTASFPATNKYPGKLIEIVDSAMTLPPWSATNFNNDFFYRVRTMLDRGLMELTGKNSVAEALADLFPGTAKKIAIKPNFCANKEGGASIGVRAEVVKALVTRLLENNVASSVDDIFIYEWNSTSGPAYPSMCGVNTLYYSTWNDYAANPGQVLRTCSTHPDSPILDRLGNNVSYCDKLYEADYLINIPILKTHPTSCGGLTGALKCHYGTIDAPQNYHAGADSYELDYGRDNIVAIGTSPAIREKQRLVIGHALSGIHSGDEGPASFAPKALFFTTDPVTCDRLFGTYINEERTKRGMGPIGMEDMAYGGYPADTVFIGMDHLLIPAEATGMGINNLAGRVTLQNTMPDKGTLSCLYVAPVSVAPNGTGQFTAIGRDAYDTDVTYADTVDWSVSGGGSISNTGLFTSNGTLGRFKVTAALHNTPAIKGAVVFKVAALTSISVAVTTVVPGGTVQMTAIGKDQDGELMTTGAIDWTVTGGGAIDNTGLFTSNGTKGTFKATATVHDKPSVTAQADIIVADKLVNICAFAGGILTEQHTDSPANEGLANVIDGNTATKYLTRSATAWIQFQAPQSYVINGCAIISANDAPERDPKDWTLEGSNDGTTWAPIDTRAGETFSARLQRKEYTFSNSTAYTYYRLTMTNNSGTLLQLSEWELLSTNASSSINASDMASKVSFQLSASPNPFAASTRLSYAVPVAQKVSIRVYDISGRLVKTLVDGHVNAGRHTTVFDGVAGNGRALVNGTYFCRMQAAGFNRTEKLLLMR